MMLLLRMLLLIGREALKQQIDWGVSKEKTFAEPKNQFYVERRKDFCFDIEGWQPFGSRKVCGEEPKHVGDHEKPREGHASMAERRWLLEFVFHSGRLHSR